MNVCRGLSTALNININAIITSQVRLKQIYFNLIEYGLSAYSS